MPGRFPGIAPYVEDPADWQSVYNRLIGVIEGALNALLPLPNAVDTEEASEACLEIREMKRKGQRVTTVEILDLQPIFSCGCDESAYECKIDYAGESLPTLIGDAALGADALRREQRLGP